MVSTDLRGTASVAVTARMYSRARSRAISLTAAYPNTRPAGASAAPGEAE
ncbi:hypothetical protein [Cryobacterium sp. Y62]|nr:hypothetical protein [Cryobacterium sp. Y62]